MNDNKEKIKLLNEQIVATVLFIVTALISIGLTYDEIKTLKGKSNNQNQRIALYNRICVFILAIYFLYNSYANKNIAKKENQELRYLNLQIVSSWLNLTSAFIILYIIIKNVNKNSFSVSQVENPVL